MSAEPDSFRPFEWTGDGLRLIDQRQLPQATQWLTCPDVAAVAAAIRDMVVRGAPAIGIAAAYGMALAARAGQAPAAAGQLKAARPTAVNLAWAVDRITTACGPDFEPEAVLAEAQAIAREDLEQNRAIAEQGARHIGQCARVYTHCNTGALATGGVGTALGVVRALHARGWLAQVYAGETRPWLQGARLTAWELAQAGIAHQLVVESAAASLMAAGQVDWVIVGADRITANGDVLNKIGTYSLAVLARHHGVKFMVAAPGSTLDPATPTGADVEIEQRSGEEVTRLAGQTIAPADTPAWNPVFDCTPYSLIDAIITEDGLWRPEVDPAEIPPLS